MTILLGAAAISTLGWAISLAFPRSAARRHLILCVALAGCVLMPLAVAIRSGTDWTLLSLKREATSSTAAMSGVHASERNNADAAAHEPHATTVAAPARTETAVRSEAHVPHSAPADEERASPAPPAIAAESH